MLSVLEACHSLDARRCGTRDDAILRMTSKDDDASWLKRSKVKRRVRRFFKAEFCTVKAPLFTDEEKEEKTGQKRCPKHNYPQSQSNLQQQIDVT
ncbi:hypothetical protein TNCV_3815951 [Trichonephila clavipes]|nr:hypothetical protein TNCV_3815951 [Trichonephila clavipes]